MTNSQTPAPRPCTLWGSTFDRNGVATPIPNTMNGSIELWLHSNSLPSTLVAHKVLGLGAQLTPHILNLVTDELKQAETILHQALHPPLCLKDFMKHYDALHEAHKPEKESLGKMYVVTDDNTMAPIMLFSHQLNSYYLLKSLLKDGYQKVTILNLDGTFYAHGDAELFVNAWEEE
jgi:hypothetical protein